MKCIRDLLFKICLNLALFCHVKNSPRSVQQNSNEKMKLDLKVSFILAFPGNICVVIFNQLFKQLLPLALDWAWKVDRLNQIGPVSAIQTLFFLSHFSVFCVHWFQWSEKKSELHKRNWNWLQEWEAEKIWSDILTWVQSHFEIEFNNGNSFEGQRHDEKSVQKEWPNNSMYTFLLWPEPHYLRFSAQIFLIDWAFVVCGIRIRIEIK